MKSCSLLVKTVKQYIWSKICQEQKNQSTPKNFQGLLQPEGFLRTFPKGWLDCQVRKMAMLTSKNWALILNSGIGRPCSLAACFLSSMPLKRWITARGMMPCSSSLMLTSKPVPIVYVFPEPVCTRERWTKQKCLTTSALLYLTQKLDKLNGSCGWCVEPSSSELNSYSTAPLIVCSCINKHFFHHFLIISVLALHSFL